MWFANFAATGWKFDWAGRKAGQGVSSVSLIMPGLSAEQLLHRRNQNFTHQTPVMLVVLAYWVTVSSIIMTSWSLTNDDKVAVCRWTGICKKVSECSMPPNVYFSIFRLTFSLTLSILNWNINRSIWLISTDRKPRDNSYRCKHPTLSSRENSW